MLVSAMTVLGIVTYRNNMLANETGLLVKHSHEVLETTNEISSLYKDIQLESNAFFISKDSAIIPSYLSSRKMILPLIDRLKDLTADNQPQQYRIATLRLFIENLKIFTDSVINSPKTQKAFTQIINRINTNNRFRVKIRGIINNIKAAERRLLIMREEANAESIAAFNKTFFLLIGGIAILLSTTFFSIRYYFNRRVKAQEELRNVNELYTKLFYESPLGIVMSRLDTGEIVDCNNAYAELINYNKSELIGRTAVELGILPTIAQRKEIVSGSKSNEIARDIEVQLKPKDREPIWVSISMQSILVNNEHCLLSAILDMTAHKEAEEKVKRALISEIELNKLKSNFVTLASHEFRTPLTTILSSTFLLENYSCGENRDRVGKHVSRIKASVNLLTSILDEFLSLTKIEEGKVEPKNEKVNLRQTLESLCHNFKTIAKTGQSIIYHHIGEEEIYSDPLLLGNIVNNLVSNAIKYSNENKEIYVSSVVNAKVHVSVKDKGIGISRDDQEHLFERFFRAANADNVQGTGLGLHIMKHYVDLLHGSIEVISEPGKGSEFKITLDHMPEGR